MGRLLMTMAALIAMHSGAGALQAHQAAPAGGIGAYVQTAFARGSAPYSGGSVYGTVVFGESVPRPASATVRVGW